MAPGNMHSIASVLVHRTQLHCLLSLSTRYPGNLSTFHVPIQTPAIKGR